MIKKGKAMGNYGTPGTCSCCTHYTYEGENTKGYCSHYRSYYYPNDSCPNYEEGEISSSGGCFLTQACCAYRNLPDDCEQLVKMRKFRDQVLLKTENGQRLVKFYYNNAPRIVKQLEKNCEKETLYQWIYERICTILAFLEQGDETSAIVEYMLLTYNADLRSRPELKKEQ